jgi:hypothetical protein
MSNALTVMADKMTARFGMIADGEILEVLKSTCFRSDKEVTDAQMTALLVVGNQYGLNPWTKEIYAFPDKRGGIVPVVGLDGWARIINEHPQFDGMDFESTPNEVTCIIHRKDRTHPTRITEYLSECQRSTDPWKSHPRRMLRHKAMIQCARLAFGFVGIYESDEAERIIEAVDQSTGEITKTRTKDMGAAEEVVPRWPDDAFEVQFARWSKAVESGIKTVDDIIAMAESRGALSKAQEKRITDLSPVTVIDNKEPTA